jgi:hypothetical protein
MHGTNVKRNTLTYRIKQKYAKNTSIYTVIKEPKEYEGI